MTSPQEVASERERLAKAMDSQADFAGHRARELAEEGYGASITGWRDDESDFRTIAALLRSPAATETREAVVGEIVDLHRHYGPFTGYDGQCCIRDGDGVTCLLNEAHRGPCDFSLPGATRHHWPMP